jgi:hypothetical protein
MKIHLEIGELVLQGFDFHDHPRIRHAIERELSRLIMESGLPGYRNGASIPKIDAGSFDLPKNTEPGVIGANVASLIYKGLTESIG